MLSQLRNAGRALGVELASLRDEHPFVLAIPRRGVVVGVELARILRAPLDVVLVATVGDGTGAPMGALALGGTPILPRGQPSGSTSDAELTRRFAEAQARLEGRLAAIRGDAALPELRGRTVVLVDDAIVTGLTMTAALDALDGRHVGSIIVATPLASVEAAARLGPSVRAWHALAETTEAEADARHSSASYGITPPISDAELRDMLTAAWQLASPGLGSLELDGI